MQCSAVQCSAVQRSSAKAVRPANSLALAVVFYIEIRGRLDSQLDVVVAGRAGHGHGHVSGPWPWPRPGVALTDLRSLQTQLQTSDRSPQAPTEIRRFSQTHPANGDSLVAWAAFL